MSVNATVTSYIQTELCHSTAQIYDLYNGSMHAEFIVQVHRKGVSLYKVTVHQRELCLHGPAEMYSI